MARQILATILVALLTGASVGQAQSTGRPSPKEQIREAESGTPAEVRFVNGTRVRGWVSEAGENGFVLSHETNRQLEKTDVSYSDVKSVKWIRNVKKTHTARNIVIGVVIAVVAIGAACGIFIARNGLG